MKECVLILLLITIILPNSVYADDEYYVVSETKKYYKTTYYETDISTSSESGDDYSYVTEEITKEEYDSVDTSVELTYSTSVYTEYKEMSTYIMSNGSNYRYKVNLDWKKFPKIRSYDIIGLGHYSSVKLSGDVYFNTDYCIVGGSCACLINYTVINHDNGNSVIFKLPSDTINVLTSTLYFDVEKSNSNSTVTTQKAAGDYAHATKKVTISSAKKHYVDYYGITITNGIDEYYDSIDTAYAGLSTSW